MDGEDLGLLDGTGEAAGGGEGGDGGEETFILPEGEGEGEGEGGGEGEGKGGQGEGAGEGDGGEGSRAIVKLEPLAIRKALRDISTSNPEFAKKFPTLEKAVTTALYKSGQIEKFGGVQAISEAMEAIELHGGVEGIQELVDEVAAARELKVGFERGDPKVVDGWSKDYPLGFKKLIVPALDKLETLDKTHFENVASYVIEKVFTTYGVFGAIAALGEAISAGKNEDAVKQFNSVAKFLGDSKALASKARIGQTDRDAELDERESSIEERDRKAFYGSVRQDVNTQMMSEMNRLIRLGLNGKKIKVDTANRLRKEINSELARVVNSRAGYADRYNSVMAAKNKERAVRFITTNARQALPAVVRQMLKEFNLTVTGGGTGGDGARRAVNRGGSGGGGSNIVTGRPKTADVDFTRTDKAVWLSSVNAGRATGKIFLKTGKQAKW